VIRKLSGNPLLEIGNHSFDHGAFSRPCYGLPPAKEKTAEVTKTQEILYRVSGKLPTFFRFPGGCASVIDHARVYLLGVRAVGWDVNSADAFSDDGQKIVERVLSNTQGGSIIVMHLSGSPNAPATALVLPTIIKGLRDRGFSFVTISELIAQPEEDSSWTLFSEP
jgi:peptidoglycan/xylan/chitin deacetylase (PgdA/CDA1 family)